MLNLRGLSPEAFPQSGPKPLDHFWADLFPEHRRTQGVFDMPSSGHIQGS